MRVKERNGSGVSVVIESVNLLFLIWIIIAPGSAGSLDVGFMTIS